MTDRPASEELQTLLDALRRDYNAFAPMLERTIKRIRLLEQIEGKLWFSRMHVTKRRMFGAMVLFGMFLITAALALKSWHWQWRF